MSNPFNSLYEILGVLGVDDLGVFLDTFNSLYEIPNDYINFKLLNSYIPFNSLYEIRINSYVLHPILYLSILSMRFRWNT